MLPCLRHRDGQLRSRTRSVDGGSEGEAPAGTGNAVTAVLRISPTFSSTQGSRFRVCWSANSPGRQAGAYGHQSRSGARWWIPGTEPDTESDDHQRASEASGTVSTQHRNLVVVAGAGGPTVESKEPRAPLHEGTCLSRKIRSQIGEGPVDLREHHYRSPLSSLREARAASPRRAVTAGQHPQFSRRGARDGGRSDESSQTALDSSTVGQFETKGLNARPRDCC